MKKSNVLLKKSSISSLFLYLLVYIITSIILILLESILILIIGRYIYISQSLENIFAIINRIILAFLSTFIFVKVLKNKFKITDSRENFLHKFLIFIILISSIDLIFNLIHGKNEVFTQIDTMGAVDKYIISAYQNDKTELNKFVQGTDYENYESYNDLFEISEKLRCEMIYYKLIQPIIYNIVAMLSNILFIELLIRKEDIFINAE